jgi:Helix-turn-helix domain
VDSYTKCNTGHHEKGDLVDTSRLHISTKRKKATLTYHQITCPERYVIARLRAVGARPAAIARELGRHRSTILRELRRNRNCEDRYRAQPAHGQAVGVIPGGTGASRAGTGNASSATCGPGGVRSRSRAGDA